MIPKIIHSIWLGGKLPAKFRPYVDSVTRHHMDWQHIIWDESKLLEEGKKHGVDQEDFDRMKAHFWSWASVSNFLRLGLIKKYGGIYLDVDCECVRPLDGLLGHSAFAAFQDGDRLCNAVFGAEPDHPWIRWQFHHLSGQRDRHDAAWGVYTMSEAPRDGLTILPTETFYPWHFSTPPEHRKVHPDSLLIHHWDGSWTK